MTRRFRDSIIEHGLNSVQVVEGRIVNVNMAKWTVDVLTRDTQQTFTDITVSSPYFHFDRGEGIYVMPEVGAKVKVCRPSDGDPFVMCFVAPSQRPVSDSSEDEDANQPVALTSFRANRPAMQQGDIMLRTRDGNAVWLRRGGIIEIGATNISKRIYIPLLNYIRDVCENYSMWSGGGALTWTVARADNDPDGNANAVLRISSRDVAQDAKATVAVALGHVGDDDRYHICIAPRAINVQTQAVDGTPVYDLVIDKDGNYTETVGKDYDLTVSGELSWSITGSASMRFSSSLEQTVGGDMSLDVSGSLDISAGNSTERCTSKVIDSSDIRLGGSGATANVALATAAFQQWVLNHKHPIEGATTGIPTPPAGVDWIATKVKGQ
jgi:hypothetical protein